MGVAPDLPDFDALALERIRLQRRLKDVESRHERLVERVAVFPNTVTLLEERRLRRELEEVRERIGKIDATLLPLRLGQ